MDRAVGTTELSWADDLADELDYRLAADDAALAAAYP